MLIYFDKVTNKHIAGMFGLWKITSEIGVMFGRSNPTSWPRVFSHDQLYYVPTSIGGAVSSNQLDE